MTIRKAQRAGKTVLVIDIPFRTPDGRQCRYRRDAQVQTKTAAEAEHKRLIAELVTTGRIETRPSPLVKVKERAPEEPAPTSPLVKDVGQDFLDFLKSKKPSSRCSYTEVYRRVIEPRWGEIPIGDFGFAELAKLDQDMAEKSPSSRRNVHIVMRSLLRFSVDRSLIGEFPKLPKLPKVGSVVLTALRREDVEAIVAHATRRSKVAFALMIWAGLRPGEIRGLTWDDVDLERGHIIVRHAVTHGETHKPKSGHERQVPLSTALRTVLEGSEPEKKKRKGLVAPSKRGLPWGDWGLHQAFQRARKLAQVHGKFRLYDLRHYFVTSCFRAGVPAPTIQRLVGHSSLTVTERYAHMASSDLRDGIDRLDQMAGNRTETTPQDVARKSA